MKKAGRRHFANLTLEYAAIAASIGAVGVILLLLLGTQIMDWYWPVLLFVAGLAAGLYRARKHRLTRYGVAQMVDARLGLDDRISTLVWFREQQRESPALLATVERQAQERLRPEDSVRAVPVKIPRQAWASLALVVAAAGLVGVRYGVLHSLDLGAPIARIDLGAFQPEPKVHAASKKSAIQERYEQQLKELGINVDDLEKEKGIQPIEANVPATAEEGMQSDPANKQKGDAKQPSPEGTEGKEGAEKGDQSQGDSKESADGQAGDQDGQKGKPQQGQPKQPPQNAKQGQPGSENSLMNKMRDALANMLNKMKNQPQNEQQTASNQKQSEQQAGKQGQQSQQGQQSSSKSQGEGQQGQQQQGDQDSDGQKSASDKSKPGDKNSDKPGSQDSKSGMGLSDGDKDIHDAEQLAAMGKISQIFGKRAQEITGEISVEVASGKQQLKTAWSERKALHSDSGAEVNRDEIPLAYQSYIQRYFEEVRKAPAAPKPAKAGS